MWYLTVHVLYWQNDDLHVQGGLGTVDFHTSEQWTFDMIHCYLRLPGPIAKVNAVRRCGWEKIKIAPALRNLCVLSKPTCG